PDLFAAADAAPASAKGEATKPPQKNLFGEQAAPSQPPRAKRKPPADSDGPRTGRRWKQLADFVTGSCNRFAHASAAAVVEDPGQDANPLVLHGPVGTGKTHLLEGIYAGLRKAGPDARPCLVSAEEFTARFVQATRFGKQSAFRRQFRECTSLLLDD